MLRISKLTDYGVALMAHLAQEPARVHTASELSAALLLGAPTVSKLMKQLARGGLLSSQRGVNGGYALARDAGDISVADIVDALEGAIALTECALPGACSQAEHCSVKGNWMALSTRCIACSTASVWRKCRVRGCASAWTIP